MVQEIIQYPTPPSAEYATDVRVFNENIFSLIDNLKDTIEANDLDGLAAFQIGSYFNIVVVKDDNGEFLELINPRMLSTKGRVTTEEKTAYFPGLSAEVERHEKISIIYQDREANDCSMKAEGALSILLQRKIDFTFGASFLSKLSKEEKKLFEAKLEHGPEVAISEVCPTTFKRDYLVKLSNILTIIIAAIIVISFFIENTKSLWDYQLYIALGVVVTNIIYFFYAQYEGRGLTSCSSCQIGNIFGTVVIGLIKLALIMSVSYFLVNPS